MCRSVVLTLKDMDNPKTLNFAPLTDSQGVFHFKAKPNARFSAFLSVVFGSGFSFLIRFDWHLIYVFCAK